MVRVGDIKTRSSRTDDGSSSTKCPKGGRRPKEQPHNKVWKPHYGFPVFCVRAQARKRVNFMIQLFRFSGVKVSRA